MTTRATRSRAGWSAAVVVSPIVAALAAGSVLWATNNDPRAAAQPVEPAAAVQVVGVDEGQPTAEPSPDAIVAADATAADEPTLKELRKTLAKLERKIDTARKEAKAARQAAKAGTDSGASTWTASGGSSGGGSSSGGSSSSSSSNSGGSSSNSGGSASNSGGGQAAPAPAPAPVPAPAPPADTWTGSSGG